MFLVVLLGSWGACALPSASHGTSIYPRRRQSHLGMDDSAYSFASVESSVETEPANQHAVIQLGVGVENAIAI